MIDLITLTIKKAHEALVKREYSALELAESYLSEIEKKNTDLNAYLEVFDDVREQAKLAVMGGTSLVCWLTAITAGRMIGYW